MKLSWNRWRMSLVLVICIATNNIIYFQEQFIPWKKFPSRTDFYFSMFWFRDTIRYQTVGCFMHLQKWSLTDLLPLLPLFFFPLRSVCFRYIWLFWKNWWSCTLSLEHTITEMQDVHLLSRNMNYIPTFCLVKT